MKKILFSLIATVFLTALAPEASAHLGYTGRDFGTDPGSVTITNQAASSQFGWADATDADWGDSHRGRFFRFTLSTTASVVISVTRGGNGTATGAADTFLPAVSLYAGLGTVSPKGAGHDGAALSIASRPEGTEGSFRALANWSLGNDPTYNTPGDATSGVLYPAELASFTYIGHLADGTSANFGDAVGINGDGLADGYVTATFQDLSAGDYSFFVGGANYAAQSIETGPTYPTYAFTATVQTVPEPSTWALIALGAGALGYRFLRRKTV